MALEAAQQDMYQYAYQVTRATLIHQPTTTILYTIQSGAVSIYLQDYLVIGLLTSDDDE